MNLDLGSPALEVAIALAFVFFLLSVIASAINEFLAGVFRLRSGSLRKGIEEMLGDPSLAKELFAHPLVRTQVQKKPVVKTRATEAAAKAEREKQEAEEGKRRRPHPHTRATLASIWKRERGPSYIAPRTFALALKDLLDSEAAPPQQTDTGLLHPVHAQLQAISEHRGGGVPSVPKLEKWFDDAMDRVSGFYKRQSQWITIVVAILVTAGLNASALRIADRLEAEPAVRSAVAAQAEASAGGEEFKQAAGKEEEAGEASPAKTVETAGKEVEEARSQLAALKLPIFWNEKNIPHGTSEILTMIVGWLITMIAISLGAPFWFDALGKLSNLRQAGAKPGAKPKQ